LGQQKEAKTKKKLQDDFLGAHVQSRSMDLNGALREGQAGMGEEHHKWSRVPSSMSLPY
jgi:hypothetical protein